MAILTATAGIVVPLGQYLLQFRSCKEVDGTNYTTKEPEVQLEWGWRVERVMEVEPTREQLAVVGQEFREWTSILCTPNSKSRARAEALMDRRMALNESLDTDPLIGRRIIATFVNRKQSEGTAIGPVRAYAASTEPVVSASEMSGKAAQGNGAATPFMTLREAYNANVGEGKPWTTESAIQILHDLYGVEHSSLLHPGQLGEFADVLAGKVPVKLNPDGKYQVDVPF